MRLHSKEERVRTHRPGVASGPTMPKHGVGAAPERCLLPLAVTAAPPRGHHEAVRLTSHCCGHKDISTSSQGSTRGILAIRASRKPLGAKRAILVSL